MPDVIIRVPELTDEVRKTAFRAPASELNSLLAQSGGWSEARFASDVEVDAEVYRQGTDVFFSGRLGAPVQQTCRRCLDEFTAPLQRSFKFLIVKNQGDAEPRDDAGLDHYDGEELDLVPLVREQALLAIDDGALCDDGCRGLCAGCGANLNRESCRCGA